MLRASKADCLTCIGYLLYIPCTMELGMSVTLRRWGNSMGLRLPKPLLDQLGLGEGSQVDLKVENGRLVIEPHRARRLTLKDVLKGFSPDDRPGEVGWGPPVGKEVW